MFFFRKGKRKRNRYKISTNSSSQKKNGITREQMYAISEAIIRKKRLMVYADSM